MNSKEKKGRSYNMREWAKKPSMGGFEATAIKYPEGVEGIKLPATGIIRWDFIPYVAGSYNRRCDEGYEAGELEYEVHRVPVGAGHSLFLCEAKMRNKPCAVCDWVRKYGATVDPKTAKDLRNTSTRHLWVVNDKPGDAKNKLKIFDSNHYNKQRGFGEQMAAAINTLEENEDPFDLKTGYTAVITCVEDTFPGGKYSLASRIDLKPRKYEYPESIVKKAPCLDDCLIFPDYDDLMAILEGGGSSRKDEDEDERPQRSAPTRSKARDDDDEEDQEDTTKDADSDDAEEEDTGSKTAQQLKLKVGAMVKFRNKVYEILTISKDGTSIAIEDEDGNTKRGIDPNDVDPLDDEEDEEPAPRKASESKSKAKAKPKDDEDEDEPDDEDEDEPVKPRKRR